MENSIFMLEFFNSIDIFLLIIVRLAGFFMLLPVFSGNTIPAFAKILFIVPLAFMVYTTGVVTEITYDGSMAGLVFLMVKEFVVGLTMSFVVYTIFMALFMAGQLIDFQIGFSMVSVTDFLNQIQVPITGNLMYMLIMLLLIRSGGLETFIAAIFRSFDALPRGPAVRLENGYIANYVLSLIANYINIGVQIALPIVGTVLVLDTALGLLVKAAPQMNIFVVGLPIKLLVGLVIFYSVIPIFANVFENLYVEAYKALLNVMGGMSP